MARRPKLTLSQQISEIANPAPVFHDPEDDVCAETVARLVDEDEEEEVDKGKFQTSRLRTQNVSLLAETDARYAGKKISRKELLKKETQVNEFSSSSSSSESSDDDDQEASDPSDDEVDIADFNMQIHRSQDTAKHVDEEEEAENAECLETSVAVTEDEDEEEEDEETKEEEVVRQLSKVDIRGEMKKGLATKAQLTMWDSSLESRIKLQKSLKGANQLPQHDVWTQFMTAGDEEFRKILVTAQQNAETVLKNLTNLQTLMLVNNQETKDIANPADNRKDHPVGRRTASNNKRNSQEEDYSECAAKRHKAFQNFRNVTIQKWNDKTRLSVGKASSKSFAAFEQSVLKQIEMILCDRKRLVQRTQLTRSNYRVLGKMKGPQQQQNLEEDSTEGGEAHDAHLKNYDPEIFDDDDFYHQLLRELIERRAVNEQDPVALGRQWLEIQKLRSKIKKKVDTKASKARRIRYDVHKKLENTMAPVDNCAVSAEYMNDLYSSLFGKRTLFTTTIGASIIN